MTGQRGDVEDAQLVVQPDAYTCGDWLAIEFPEIGADARKSRNRWRGQTAELGHWSLETGGGKLGMKQCLVRLEHPDNEVAVVDIRQLCVVHEGHERDVAFMAHRARSS